MTKKRFGIEINVATGEITEVEVPPFVDETPIESD
jgi:hypothetical protein